MRIESSQVNLQAEHRADQQLHERESLRLFQVDEDGQVTRSVELSSESRRRLSLEMSQQQAMANNRPGQQLPAELGTLAPDERQINEPVPLLSSPTATIEPDQDEAYKPELSPRLKLIKALLEQLTGREINLSQPELDTDPNQAAADVSAGAETGIAPLPQAGMRYEYERTYIESEQTEFQAQGKVRTSDGREIDFALDLKMSREYIEHDRVLIEAGAKLKDPLVINLDVRAAELRADKFEFDIDADGQLDEINQLASHSGMLALDKNGDGTINDGRELFGALSGNGFADLAAYDDDNNGWIDEADDVYDQLRVWIKKDNGDDQLLSLNELQVGALYLGSTDTPFELKNSSNELQGKIRATGVYLSENGQAGTLQQIDLVT
ncbi:hypothetical protein DV711_12370 [Motiliproteus coralliicola]|uniref:VCBS repeat-containing protein n=1 Tax=Motiliproteus coralliicola TaxID=2283196 RepID=A0A369WEA8_9GAMM|nr:hypothetical protein [Motiliproteus coralliicola]RDE19671.1 hypothetical protein DV711_12370 [Motiliproteus coralliicola]